MTDHSRLDALGVDPDSLNPEQLAVLESLTDQELELLARIRKRLDETAGDVEGHMDGGGFCW